MRQATFLQRISIDTLRFLCLFRFPNDLVSCSGLSTDKHNYCTAIQVLYTFLFFNPSTPPYFGESLGCRNENNTLKNLFIPFNSFINHARKYVIESCNSCQYVTRLFNLNGTQTRERLYRLITRVYLMFL